ncbi:MAG: type II secretion system protein [Synergistaceae bacterium]|nr:type II secretion system protein [Synergistaceae bacterium]
MKNFSQRKGFTLVELLIVIVVIGVLSAMMMLSSTEAVSSAKAATIISDMRVLKTAVLEWYMDNLDKVKKNSKGEYKINDKYIGDYFSKEGQADLQKYLGNSAYVKIEESNYGANTKTKIAGCYFLASETRGEVSQAVSEGTAEAKELTGCSWYVGYCFRENEDKLKEKLQARATSLGLVGGNMTGTKKDVLDTYKAPGDFIYMLIQDLD